jgi:hypothetical protein
LLFAQASLDFDSPIYASHVAGRTGVSTKPGHWWRWGSP